MRSAPFPWSRLSLPLGLGELAADQHPRTVRSNPLVVQFSLSDGKYLARPERDRTIVLMHDERTQENQPSDLEQVTMPSFAGSRSQLLGLYLGKTVGPQLAFKVAFGHRRSPQRAGACKPIRRPQLEASNSNLAEITPPARARAPGCRCHTGSSKALR